METHYKKRHGIENKGKRYEVATSTLIPLRLCLNVNVEDFKIAHDMENCGMFDDIVMKVQYKNPEKTCKLYAIQVKHKENSDLEKGELSKTSSKFCLKKYCANYYKNKSKFDNLNSQVSEQNITLCLFTNAKLKESDRIPIKSSLLSCKGERKKPQDFDFINTQEDFYTFEVTQDDILDEFQSKLQQRLPEFPTNSEDTSSVNLTDYGHFVRDVIKNEGAQIFKDLDHPSLTQAICECFQNKRIYKQYESSKITDEIKRATKGENVDVFDSFFQDYFAHRFHMYLRSRYTNFFRVFRFYDGQLNVEGMKERVKALIENKFGELPQNYVKQLTKYVKKYFKNENIMFLTKDDFILNLFQQFIDNNSERARRLCDTFHMEVDERKTWLAKTIGISFNGKKAMSLYDLTNSKFYMGLTTGRLMNYSDQVIEMGKKLKAVSDDYVKRKFYKILLRKEVLWKTRKNVFILNNRFNEHLPNITQHSVSPSGPKPKTIYFYKSSGSLIQIDRKLRSEHIQKKFSSMVNLTGHDELAIEVNGENIVLVLGDFGIDECVKSLMKEENLSHYAKHYLKVRGTNLEWCRSWDDAFHLNSFLIESETVDEENLLQHFTNPLNVISAIPGIGKTTVLDSLMRHCPQNKLALKLNLSKFNKKEISKLLEDPSSYMFDLNGSFKRDLIQWLKDDKKIVLFVDAFDEIAPEYAEQFVDLFDKLKTEVFSIWLVMRPITKRYIRKFNILTINMKGFSEEQVTSYITNQLGYVSPILRKTPPEFIAVPLHVSIICNIWKSKSLGTRSPQIDFPVLYEAFVQEKLSMYCERKFSNVINLSQADLAGIKKEALRNHQIASLWYTYGTEFLIKHGIVNKEEMMMDIAKDNVGLIVSISDVRPIFCHRAIADFLTADWLAKNSRHPAGKEMYKILFKPGNEFACSMFERIVAKDCPLHLAVVDGDLKRIQELCLEKSHHYYLDDLGRTPLHLAAVGCFENFKIIEQLIEYLPQSMLVKKDSLLERNFIDYANFVGVKLFHIAAEMASLKFFHCAQTILQSDVMACNINAVDEDGFTPLHKALESEQIECAEFLIVNGADVESKTKSGLTPADFATQNGDENILKLLQSREGKPR